MRASRSYPRSLLVILLVAGCAAAAIAPLLVPVGAAPDAATAPAAVVISEFRFNGSGGSQDEFVELFNRSCTQTINLKGWELKASDGITVGTPVYTFTTKVTLAPGHYYLLAANPGYDDPPPAAAPDATYTVNIDDANGGVALFAAGGTTPVDQVGYNLNGYHEGDALVHLNGAFDQSYARKKSSLGGIYAGMYVDNADNAADFSILNPSEPQNSSNTGKCGFPAPVAPGTRSVLISEIAWGGTRWTASDQWIELHNPNPWAIDVTDWQLIGPGISKDSILDLIDLYPNGIMPANSFGIIEANKDVFKDLPSNVKTLVPDKLTLSTFGERIDLHAPNGSIDTADYLGEKWPAGVGAPDRGIDRRSMERHDSAPDSATAWFTFAGSLTAMKVHDHNGYLVEGTPGYANWADNQIATASPAPTKYKTPTAPPPTPFAHMVLNEFLPRAGHDYNQDGTVDVYDEFIEVKNLGPINVNLSGWKIDVISSAGASSYSLPSKVLQPDQRAVYYGSVTHISLHDSGGTVRLTNTRGIIIDARGYAPVNNPDQSTCRLPDGYYWRFPCFPTPGNENSQTGTAPIPPPNTGGHPAPCLLADTVPDAFRLAECNGFGSDIFNGKYWDDQSGFKDFPVLDTLDKWLAIVK